MEILTKDRLWALLAVAIAIVIGVAVQGLAMPESLKGPLEGFAIALLVFAPGAFMRSKMSAAPKPAGDLTEGP